MIFVETGAWIAILNRRDSTPPRGCEDIQESATAANPAANYRLCA